MRCCTDYVVVVQGARLRLFVAVLKTCPNRNRNSGDPFSVALLSRGELKRSISRLLVHISPICFSVIVIDHFHISPEISFTHKPPQTVERERASLKVG